MAESTDGPRGGPVDIVSIGWRQLPAVYRVHRHTFPYPYGLWRFAGYQLNAESCILAARGDGAVVGYVIGTVTTHAVPPRRVGEIISLAVLPAWRGHGLGWRLLEAAITFLGRQDVDDVFLQVAISNEGAQRLYDRMGFVRQERLPHYYLNGEDAYLMKLSLDTLNPERAPAQEAPGA